ncbi:hypothetical protein CY0110_15972 [Crocosphaera chwakensis CCY0110]|uniref:Uncharacterized protein n=1 Tax=Crocosphaera chwakensis CCY0110 TaxID=391612 RepID=A3IHM6_9CHRO|nr:hypothetical protein CY0110_15972 [Crocosphaera chwakensis CCY0110]
MIPVLAFTRNHLLVYFKRGSRGKPFSF